MNTVSINTIQEALDLAAHGNMTDRTRIAAKMILAEVLPKSDHLSAGEAFLHVKAERRLELLLDTPEALTVSSFRDRIKNMTSVCQDAKASLGGLLARIPLADNAAH